MIEYQRKISLFIYLFIINIVVIGQNKSFTDLIPDITVMESNIPSNGYFFISSEEVYSQGNANYISIIDNYGTPVYFKQLAAKANDFKLHENGFLSYNLSDSIFIMDSAFLFVDTITVNPYKLNRNAFIINAVNEKIVLAYNYRNQDLSAVFAGGDNNATVVESIIIKINDEGNSEILWNSEDYFSVTDINTESVFVDITNDTVDYIGLVDFVMDTDTTLLLSCQNMDEITKINLNSGELVWRLGGKNNEFSFINNSIIFSQQSSIDFSNNSLFVFDNGILHENPVTNILEYTIDEQNKIIEQVNRYCHKDSIVVQYNGNVQKNSNGNLIINWGNNSPSITELFENGCEALELDFSDHSYLNSVSKADWQTNLFTPIVDTINYGMWEYTEYPYLLRVDNNSSSEITINSAHHFCEDGYFIKESDIHKTISANGNGLILITFHPETIEIGIIKDVLTLNVDTENQRISQQVYLIGYRDDFITPVLTTDPVNDETNVSVNSTVLLDFGEPLQMMDNTEITYQNVKDMIEFKQDNDAGTDIEYDVKLSSAKDYIILKPINKLSYNTTYYVALINDLKDYYDLVLPSASFTFTTEILSDIEHVKNPNIKIYPNPVNDALNVFSENKIIEEIIIVDITGRKIYNRNNLKANNHMVDFNGFNKGIYIMSIKFIDGKAFTKKIIKY